MKLTNRIRNVARVWSILLFVLLTFMLFGHLFFPEEETEAATLVEIIAAIFFPFGATIGMIISWKKEGLGAFITLGSGVIFYLLILIPRDRWMMPTFLIFFGPGFLFLTYWLLTRKK